MSIPALQAGQVLDDTYRIVRRIGEGGMGEVYEATHARLAGRYALKLLLREVGQDPSLLARFQREAQVTSALRHPNIVQVVDFRMAPGGTSYIVMEYLDGLDLAAEIRRSGPLPLERVRGLVSQIAAGLAAAHEQGVVHRDLKPANLFLVVLPGSGAELAKIVDFGISKVRTSETQLTRTATVMGTPQYMAPEQALGQIDRIDGRTDQFALATITYEMLAGRCAFAGDTIPTVLYQLVHVEPPPLTINGRPASPALDAVVRRGLAKQPEARFESVLAFARAFDAAASAEPRVAGGSTAVGSAATALATEPPAPLPAASPARPALTTLGASAGQAETRPEPARTDGIDAPSPAGVGGARRRAPVLVVGGAALAAVALAVALFTSRSRAPEASAGGASAPSAVVAPAPGAGAGSSPAAAPAATAMAPGATTPAPATTTVKADDAITISVEDAPPQLTAAIDGARAGAPPWRLAKGSGKHEVRFEAGGYRPRTLQLDSTKDLALVLSLKRAKAPRAAAVPASVPAPTPAEDAPVAAVAPGPQPAAAYVPPGSPTTTPPAPAAPPEKRKSGRFRHGVDAVSDFAKRHFGTAGRN